MSNYIKVNTKMFRRYIAWLAKWRRMRRRARKKLENSVDLFSLALRDEKLSQIYQSALVGEKMEVMGATKDEVSTVETSAFKAQSIKYVKCQAIWRLERLQAVELIFINDRTSRSAFEHFRELRTLVPPWILRRWVNGQASWIIDVVVDISSSKSR